MFSQPSIPTKSGATGWARLKAGTPAASSPAAEKIERPAGSGTSGESRKVELEGVFVQIGLVPNSEWLKGTMELTRHGEIVVDPRGQTSVPGVFAAGDVTTVPFKQIIIATGDGAKAALGAFDHIIRQAVPA